MGKIFARALRSRIYCIQILRRACDRVLVQPLENALISTAAHLLAVLGRIDGGEERRPEARGSSLRRSRRRRRRTP